MTADAEMPRCVARTPNPHRDPDTSGIVHVEHDNSANLIQRWEHFYDAVWVAPELTGKCVTQ